MTERIKRLNLDRFSVPFLPKSIQMEVEERANEIIDRINELTIAVDKLKEERK